MEVISDLDKSYFHGVIEARLEDFRRNWEERNWRQQVYVTLLKVFL